LDFNLPADLTAYLDELDRFIAREIKPLEEADDNISFFDHRREWARTDFENGGLPRHEWEALLRKAKNLADDAGHLRFAIPKRYGGKDGSNLWMAVIREHFASKGLGLHNDLQNEHSIVGNLPIVTMLDRYGTEDQKAMIDGSIRGKYRITFGLTEPTRLGRDAYGDEGGSGGARQRQGLDHQRREDVDDRHARRHALRAVRAHLGQ
jgi:alkylation response protein AidB-like acyl-CoA dehydrogenase